nr:PREDICTED: neurexin-3 isoform X1 [Bemisia tabaci]XP_018912971.1 PREDICTED: neurexin-3 isoform X1 [Bemisia tabaci]XP_018912972.1 PREDICTED: neurexin-3 isoform X1 [Bemisia tabaci]
MNAVTIWTAAAAVLVICLDTTKTQESDSILASEQSSPPVNSTKNPRKGTNWYPEKGVETSQNDSSVPSPSLGNQNKVLISHQNSTVKPLVPLQDRGAELTFYETGDQKVFMMAKSNAFIQLDGNRIPTFQLRLCREISFQFRTRLPHGLLVYHSVKDRPEQLDPYALYVIVEKGQLKVVHVFGKWSTSVIVGEGLNTDKWHSVMVRIDVHGARLIARVDEMQQEIGLQGLQVAKPYGITYDLTSVVLIGGLSPEEKLHGVKYIIESFVGCIKDMVLSAGKAASDLLPIEPLIATKHDNVQEGCINKCRTYENLCFVGSQCINHYNELSCDCFGTHYEGEQCDIYTATILTLRGSSYVSYRVYDWKDRVHSSKNRISLQFKTRFDDSALFYASGESPQHHHIAVSIAGGSVIVEVELGSGGPVVATLGEYINTNHWHNLTISHDDTTVSIVLDQFAQVLTLQGPKLYLYIDPEIYIGGGPELHKKKGLKSYNNFAGSLKYVFFNEISILYELRRGNPKVHYIGMLDPEFTEAEVETIPITFPFPFSHVWWPNSYQDNLELQFDFKSKKNMAILAAFDSNITNGEGSWEMKVVNDEIRFELSSDQKKNITTLVSVKFDSKQAWHTIELIYSIGQLRLTVDFKHRQVAALHIPFSSNGRIIIGSGAKKTNLGLVGCVRQIHINGTLLEPRFLVRSPHKVGQVSIDDCKLVDPCTRPNACEHNGKCSIKEDNVTCDCKGTGYIGKNCHFAEYRKTCEELALLGYTKPDVYLIDIDGNGRFPPAHVKCEFQSPEDSTKTIVEHNLPSQIDVRGANEIDFSFNITYREFTAEMLTELISHSLNCSQYIKYDCYKAPLDLHSATWFVSAAGQGTTSTVDFIGNVKRGACPCAVNRTCVNPNQSCNCDISENKWHSDEGFFITPSSLGITQMVFLQQDDLYDDAQARITLGPLECVETNTQKYVVTFTTSQSYIEVPGWRKGDIAFSFRTTGEKAILLYQPPIRPNYPSFMVALTNDFTLTFTFTLNNGRPRELKVKSQRRLNNGEWQKIWIDYNQHHVRFMINTDYEMIDLLPEQQFGPFEGSMFIGGATEELLQESSVRQGLIGCFRGLVVNGEILDIYSYMSVHLSEIIKDCKPSCDPNPCQNGAECKELWSKFQCVCENSWAYSGTYCETNINVNGLTFVKEEAYFRKNFLIFNISDADRTLFGDLLRETTLLNLRTYDKNSVVLFANDHLNNFVLIYISNGTTVNFLFNYGNRIKNITIDYQDLNQGNSVQLAIVRKSNETVLYVNNRNNSVPVGVKLLTQYSNKPWVNPEKEVLAPQRPLAPPTEYFQVNIGGYDVENILYGSSASIRLNGYVGCIRGLKIGNNVVDLVQQVNKSQPAETAGIISGCQMKCDEKPCKNKGVCIEDFLKFESTCDCELTSYYGEFCGQEKGADFGGESVLQRKFNLVGSVSQVKVQLAFSSSDDKKERNQVLLLLQTENKRSYYLLIALNAEGELIFEEDREGASGGYGARIKYRYFLNGARHSVYYKRTAEKAWLMVDREQVPLVPIPVLSLTDVPLDKNIGTNEVQIGGVNTSDPRFAAYKSYSGCLSNVFLEVNGVTMKPLDEYMLFTKGGEEVTVMNSQGVRSAQCAFFDVNNKPRIGPSFNFSARAEQTWAEDPPEKKEFKSLYSDLPVKEEGASRVVFIIMTSVFFTIIIAVLYHVYRNHLQWKKRKQQEIDADILWQKGQSVQFMEPLMPPTIKITSYQKISTGDEPPSKIAYNGAELKILNKNDYKQITPTSVVRFRTSEDEDSNGLKENNKIIEKEIIWESIEEENEHLLEEEAENLGGSEKEADSEMKEGDEDRISSKSTYSIATTEGTDDVETSTASSEYSSSIRGLKKSPRVKIPDDTTRQVSILPPTTKDRCKAVSERILASALFSQDNRTFNNPISYLGGPVTGQSAHSYERSTSKESMISLD